MFINGPNLYHQMVIATSDVEEFTTGVIISGVKIEQPSGIVTKLGMH